VLNSDFYIFIISWVSKNTMGHILYGGKLSYTLYVVKQINYKFSRLKYFGFAAFS